MPDESDQGLMERVSGEDPQALGALLERYWTPLVSYAAGFVKDQDIAKDVVQSVFIQVWKHRKRWKPEGAVSGYLYKITRNLALNQHRDVRLRETKEKAWGTRRLEWSSPPTPQDDLRMDALRREVREAISALSERRREVFVLARFHGLTHYEIAEALGTSPQTVANQMTSALAELRAALTHLIDDELS